MLNCDYLKFFVETTFFPKPKSVFGVIEPNFTEADLLNLGSSGGKKLFCEHHPLILIGGVWI